MTRPEQRPSTPRDAWLRVRLTAEQREALSRIAAEDGAEVVPTIECRPAHEWVARIERVAAEVR